MTHPKPEVTTILAVDPGLTGALAWLEFNHARKTIHLIGVADMPTAKAQQGKTIKSHVQPAVLADMMRNPAMPTPSMVVIEDVHAMPGQGVTSMFRFGFVTGVCHGVAAALGLPISFMRPSEWQTPAGVRKGDDAGRLRAVQLFPEQSQLFSRKMDHNRADAALIGYSFLKKQLTG